MCSKRKGDEVETVHLEGEGEDIFEVFIKHQRKIACLQEYPQVLLEGLESKMPVHWRSSDGLISTDMI